MGRLAKTLGVLIFIMLIICAAYIVWSMTANKTQALFVQLTDPAHVPGNTESLNITYSGIMLHVTNKTGSSEWINTYAAGSANLISIVNLSELVAKAEIPSNSSVDMMSMEITSANITIGNTSYPLELPNATLTGVVTGFQGAGGSTLMADLSPTVLTLFGPNSTLFVMVPSLRGVILNSINGSARANAAYPLNGSQKQALAASRPGLNITSASLSSSGNQTQISVTVKDNSGSPILVTHLLLIGSMSGYVTIGKLQPNVAPSIGNITSASLLNGTFSQIAKALGIAAAGAGSENISAILSKVNISQLGSLGSSLGLSNGQMAKIGEGYLLNGSLSSALGGSLNTSQQQGLLKGLIGNVTNSSYASTLSGYNVTSLESILNEKLNTTGLGNANLTNIVNLLINAKAEAQLNRAKSISIQIGSQVPMAMLIESNATLSLPSSIAQFQSSSYGYLLNPGQSATFRFSGELRLDSGRVLVALSNGKNYKLEVVGNNGAFASTNTTES